MLRRIDIDAPWRSLNPNFMLGDSEFGEKTIIYGHNGSGKTTLSELLLQIADQSLERTVTWVDESGEVTTIRPGTSEFKPNLAVYTRKWIERNIADFLDGETAAAIVTFGREAIEAKNDEKFLEGEISRETKLLDNATNRHSHAKEKRNQVLHETQDAIYEILGSIDPRYYTKNRFSVRTIERLFHDTTGGAPGAEQYRAARATLSRGLPERLQRYIMPRTSIGSMSSELKALLNQVPTNTLIPELEGSRERQMWVQNGLELHRDLEHCLFCGCTISTQRRDALANHFDATLGDIQERSYEYIERLSEESRKLKYWIDSIETPSTLSPTARSAHEAALHDIRRSIHEYLKSVHSVIAILRNKAENPNSRPALPVGELPPHVPEPSALNSIITSHNDEVDRYEADASEAKSIVLRYLIESRRDQFKSADDDYAKTQREIDSLKDDIKQKYTRLKAIKATRYTTADMAAQLTRDLARVYGKHHLSVEVSEDGKSYICRRNGGPARNLSEGERMILSLTYFLRHLRDDDLFNALPKDRIVVIDDPSSSLDREALFATHQWLVDQLKEFGQWVVLTHDFDLLRLFLESQGRALNTSASERKSKSGDSSTLPKAAILEIFSYQSEDQRKSHLDSLPDFLARNKSEYVYLFSRIMRMINNPNDDEDIFLIPNATRRLLEIYCSFVAPHQNDFRSRLESLVSSLNDEPFRDVYDFCNRFSHGNFSASVEVLDLRTTRQQIVRCMQFLKAVDEQHFSRMCRATRTQLPSV